MSLTVFSADDSGPYFCLIVIPFQNYDEPKLSLSKINQKLSSSLAGYTRNSSGSLTFNYAQTTQNNIPATVLELAGVESIYEAPSVFKVPEDETVTRSYFRIIYPVNLQNEMMEFDELEVNGPLHDYASYSLVDSYRFDAPPKE